MAIKRMAQYRASIVLIQKFARRRIAKKKVAKRLAVIRKRQHALRMGYYGVRIAKTLDVRAPAWLAKRRKAAVQCQRLGRGYLGRKRAAWLRVMRDRA